MDTRFPYAHFRKDGHTVPNSHGGELVDWKISRAPNRESNVGKFTKGRLPLIGPLIHDDTLTDENGEASHREPPRDIPPIAWNGLSMFPSVTDPGEDVSLVETVGKDAHGWPDPANKLKDKGK